MKKGKIENLLEKKQKYAIKYVEIKSSLFVKIIPAYL